VRLGRSQKSEVSSQKSEFRRGALKVFWMRDWRERSSLSGRAGVEWEMSMGLKSGTQLLQPAYSMVLLMVMGVWSLKAFSRTR